MNLFNYYTASREEIKLNGHKIHLNHILINLKDSVYTVKLENVH